MLIDHSHFQIFHRLRFLLRAGERLLHGWKSTTLRLLLAKALRETLVSVQDERCLIAYVLLKTRSLLVRRFRQPCRIHQLECVLVIFMDVLVHSNANTVL